MSIIAKSRWSVNPAASNTIIEVERNVVPLLLAYSPTSIVFASCESS